MVFAQGGAEGNFIFGFILNLVGANVLNFIIVKMVTTALALVLARLLPKLETVASWGMLLFGVFLMAQNSVILLVH